MFHVEPRALLLAARNALLDKVHSLDTVVNVGINRVHAFDGFALSHIDHGVKGRRINVRKGFEEGFRMS